MYLQLLRLEFSLPKIVSNTPLIHTIKSFSLSDDIYKANLSNYSCTCPDWQERRSLFDFQDVRRACKHIASLMRILPYHWVLPIPPTNYRLSAIEIEGYNYGFIQKEDYWIDIFVLNRKGEVYDYGYNFSEKTLGI